MPSCKFVLQQAKWRRNLCACEMISSFDVPAPSIEWIHQFSPCLKSPLAEIILKRVRLLKAANRAGLPKSHLERTGRVALLAGAKSSTNPDGVSLGFPYFLPFPRQSPHSFPCHHTQFDPGPGWPLPPSFWGHSQCCSVDSLTVGIWGQLQTTPVAAASTPYLTMALCSPWNPGRKIHSAQPRPPTECVTWGPPLKQEGGWLSEVTWPPFPPPRPPAACSAKDVRTLPYKRFGIVVKKMWISSESFFPTWVVGPGWRDIFPYSCVRVFFFFL